MTKQMMEGGWKYLIENFKKKVYSMKKKISCTQLKKICRIGILIVQLFQFRKYNKQNSARKKVTI